jgi:membrane peptidoglycan carboxypeptidase
VARKTPDTFVPLDDLFSTPDETPAVRPRAGRRAIRFTAVSASLGVFLALILLPIAAPAGLLTRTAAQAWNDLPSELPVDESLPQQTVLLDRNGQQFATLFSENRQPVTLNQVNPNVVDALLSVEDRSFFTHSGIDLRGTIRGFIRTGQGSTQGGSTLTQQYVKNLLLTSAGSEEEATKATEQTVERKLREARYAVALEQKLSKEQILEGYLNVSYFGANAYGIGAAAQRYFGKPASDLSVSEAATLVGILKNPSRYDPTANPQASRDRRDTVLNLMVANDKLSAEEAKRIKKSATKLNLTSPPNGCAASSDPLYCDYVRRTLLDDPAFGVTPQARERAFYRGGYTIRTALDPKVAAAAREAVQDALPAKSRVAAATAVVIPGTGHVAALAMNRPWGTNKKAGETELPLPILPAYQPGSTFKPITLATALEQGFDPNERINAPGTYQPRSLNAPEGGFGNDDLRSRGRINAYQATANSVNTWYVQLVERYGVKKTAAMAQRLGMKSVPVTGDRAVGNRDGALTLGAYETSPLEVANTYATFAAHGLACPTTPFLTVTGPDGSTIDTGTECQQVLSPDVADTVTDVLSNTFTSGTASRFPLAGRPAAGKTGTTNNRGATWFAGYTPDYAAAVWVGDPRGPQYDMRGGIVAFGRYVPNVFGGTVAGPTWKQFMDDIHDGLPAKELTPTSPGVLTGSATLTPPNVVGVETDTAVAILGRAGYLTVINPATSGTGDLPANIVVAAAPDKDNRIILTLSPNSDLTPRKWMPAQPSGDDRDQPELRRQ